MCECVCVCVWPFHLYSQHCFPVWLLYESYGFPKDLTEIIANERKLSIDWDGYKAAEEHARAVSCAKQVCVVGWVLKCALTG